jgi:lysyl-tRNA synthetase class 2
MPRDLIQIAKDRETLYETVRGFFHSRGYMEVETPIVVRSPGMEPNLMPFETELQTTSHELPAALITSPEYAMKKLLGKGLEKIFTITKVFRNGEGLGGTHNPEFTMLEWYQQGADYKACMEETEALVRACANAFGKTLPEFTRARVADLFETYANMHLEDLTPAPGDTMSDAFYRMFLNIEPKISKGPIFVYDYPTYQAALARLTPDGKYGERFELYIDGVELCNAFTELVNAQEQRARFLEETEERRALGKTVFPVDEELLALLPSVRQPTFGNALGLDRLLMIATNKTSIEDVLLFPAKELFS